MISNGDIRSRPAYHWGVLSRGVAVPAAAIERKAGIGTGKATSYLVKPVDYVQFAEAVNSLGMHWLGINTPPSTAFKATAPH